MKTLKRENEFKEWLPNNKVIGKSVQSYISYLQSVQEVLGDVEELLIDGKEAALKKLTSSNFPDNKEKTITNYAAGVKKYWEFLQSQKILFLKEQEFREWLPKNGVVVSVDNYVYHLKLIQYEFNQNINIILKNGLDEPLSRITVNGLSDYPKGVVENMRSILRKYWKFLQTK